MDSFIQDQRRQKTSYGLIKNQENQKISIGSFVTAVKLKISTNPIGVDIVDTK